MDDNNVVRPNNGGATPPANPPTPPQPVAAQPTQPTNQPAMPAFMQDTKPGTPAAPGAPQPTAPKSVGGGKKKMTMLIAIVVGLVVLLGGGAAAYFGYYVPNQPENVLKRALTNTFGEDTKSVKFNGEVKADGMSAAMVSGVTFEGAAAEDGKLQATAKVSTPVGDISAELRAVDDKDLYFKVTGVKDLTKVLDQTMKHSDLSSSDMSMAYIEMLTPLLKQLDDQWIVVPMDSAESSQQVSDADSQKLADIYEKHPFLTVNEVLGNEQINGVDSRHFKVGIDKNELGGFIDEVKNANIGAFDSYKSDLDSLKDYDFSKVSVEVWVNTQNTTINQIAVKADDSGSSVNLRFTITEINPEVNVEKPTDAKSFQELLQQSLTDKYGPLTRNNSALLNSGSSVF